MPPRPLLTMSALDWLMLIGLSTLWGASYFFAKIAVAELPPTTVAFARVAVAAPIMLVICLASGELRQLPRYWVPFLVLGLINNAGAFALITWSQVRIGSGLAAVLNATTPLFAIVLAHLTTADDRITPGRAAGLVLGVAGVAVMIGPGAFAGLGDHVWGELACLAAASLYAIGAVYARGWRHLTPSVIGAGQSLAASLILLGPALVIDRPWTLAPPSTGTLLALLALGSLSTALAYFLYFRILARAGATNALLVTFLIPVSAILLGTVLLGERLEPHQIAGMAGIALGLAAIDGRAIRMVKRRWEEKP